MQREYRAVIWTKDEATRSRRRVVVFARDLDEARDQLERKYGKGTVFNLHNAGDADQPR